jgi:predicted DNA-binding protein
MGNTMLIRLNPDIKTKLSRLARLEGKAASQIIRELIAAYIKERDISSYIDSLWTRIGEEISASGYGEKDIAKAIKEVRSKKK